MKFAEEGLEAARKQNKRDSEDYFRELADAARRLEVREPRRQSPWFSYFFETVTGSGGLE